MKYIIWSKPTCLQYIMQKSNLHNNESVEHRDDDDVERQEL